MLEIKDLTCIIDKKLILDKINLSVKPGEQLAIIGPNGAGKSTLLKCLLRIIPKRSGEIFIAQKELASFSQPELAKCLTYVPQAGRREDSFTVYDFVGMGRYPYLKPGAYFSPEDNKLIREVLQLTGLTHYSQRLLHTLSGGEQQKVLIAAALAQQASFMLLDEPSTFLDPAEKNKFYEFLKVMIFNKKISVIEVTHDINRAMLNYPRVIGILQGKVIFDGSVQELREQEVLFKLYGKHFEFYPHPKNNKFMVLPGV